MAGHVRRRGKGWQARYPDPLRGGARKIERSFATKREAQDWLASQRSSILSGTHVDPRGADRRLSAVADEWRATWTGLEPKTRAGYEAILACHVLRDPASRESEVPTFYGARLGHVTPERVQTFVNALAEDKAPNTVRCVFTVLRGLTRLAVRRRYIAGDPCDAIKLPSRRSRPTRRMQFLTPDEVRALAEAVPVHDRVAIYVAAYTGLRAGERLGAAPPRRGSTQGRGSGRARLEGDPFLSRQPGQRKRAHLRGAEVGCIKRKFKTAGAHPRDAGRITLLTLFPAGPAQTR